MRLYLSLRDFYIPDSMKLTVLAMYRGTEKGAVTVIESKLKLVKVTVEMFQGKLMIRANYRPLEKTPNVLKCIGVSKAAHVLARTVVNRNCEIEMLQAGYRTARGSERDQDSTPSMNS